MAEIYPSQIGFRFSEPDFTRTFDFSQSQKHDSKYATKQYVLRSQGKLTMRYQILLVFMNQQLVSGINLISKKVPKQSKLRREADAMVVAEL